MGMYTELVLATRIKPIDSVISILRHLTLGAPTGAGITEPELPDHPLFKTDRWRWLLTCSSYYFVPRAITKLEYDEIGKYWVLISRSDLKNYDSEIEKFVDWLQPHLAADPGEMIGYSRYV